MNENSPRSLKMANFLINRFRRIFLGSFGGLYLFYGCANMQAPTGGPKDTTPPKIVKETPGNLTRNFSASKIEIEFDKFVKLKDEFSEISISPAIDKMPVFKAHKKILDIKLEQAFEKNTTYTINFGKAIVDVNEGNVFKNYSYVFSTGDHLDSLSISGNVKSILTGTPLKDVIVFILPTKQDSLFGKKKASFFTSTDSAGNFMLKNLKADMYRIYALKKAAGGERIYNSNTDEIGFLRDSLALNKSVNDIELNVFKEAPAKLRRLSDKIEADGRISLVFNKPITELRIIDPLSLDQKKTIELGSKKDSAFVWLPELTFDSLKIEASDKNRSRDTITLNRGKKDTYNRSVLVYSDNLLSGGKLKPRSELRLTTSSPVAGFDITKMSLLQDSVPVQGFEVLRDPVSARKFVFKFAWRPKKSYVLSLLDGSFTDIFGMKSKVHTQKLMLDSEDNYGDFSLSVTVPDTSKSYLIQCLNEKDIVLRTDIVSNNKVIKYSTYPVGKYHIRVIYDVNKNGEWDSGNVLQRLQPENIWNLDKIISLRANWEIEESLIIPAAVDQ